MSESDIPYIGGSRNSLQSAWKFCYDGETGAIFTRTPASWGKIGLFYLIYYSGLAAFFAGMLAIFLYGFTDDAAPRLVGNYSILPQNPCMGFRPQPDETRSLIMYDEDDPKTYQDYVESMHDFLSNPHLEPSGVSYFHGQDATSTGKFRNCSDDSEMVTSKSKPCTFDLSKMASFISECVGVNQTYGFPSGTPCVAIKLNRIFEFVPDLIINDVKDNVTASPPYLQIECEGLHFADKDNIGPIDYFPKPGIDMWHFPFLGQEHYLSPLVFVKFANVTRNVLVQVDCRPTNARNIVQNKHSKGSGRVQFELMIMKNE